MNKSLQKILELGPTSQPAVAGIYAWAVTVAPVGYGKHGATASQNWAATIFATLAFAALVRGAIAEALLRQKRESLERSRTLTLLSFAGASLITWICDEDALSPIRMSTARGVAGMLGWALFAYACAAPVVELDPAPARVEAGARARGRVERGDAIFVGVATAMALALQLIGWRVASPERALLVRVTTLGSAVLLLGGVGAFVSTRHGIQPDPPQRARIRMTRTPLPLGWVIALLLLIAGGVFYVLIQ